MASAPTIRAREDGSWSASYSRGVIRSSRDGEGQCPSVGDGMQQGLEYAATLHILFVFSSNGDGFVFHYRTGIGAVTETDLALDAFPSPAELWAK